jgi:hypothetical protein
MYGGTSLKDFDAEVISLPPGGAGRHLGRNDARHDLPEADLSKADGGELRVPATGEVADLLATPTPLLDLTLTRCGPSRPSGTPARRCAPRDH